MILSKFSTHRVSDQCTLANFVQVLGQKSCFPLGGHYGMPMRPISSFVASSSVGIICHHHTFYFGQYLKNGLSDLIQIWHVDVTSPAGVLYSFLTLNSH